MANIKVSVVTVTFNSAKTVAKTIESVLRQTYKDIDYWIIDGSSNDNTINIVKSYAPQFQGRMHWISEPDRGIYDAMNKGIAKCTGDIVGFLNSDDWFTSNDVIKCIVDNFSNNIDAVYGNIHSVSSDAPDKIRTRFSSHFFHPCLLRFGIAPPHPAFYVRTKIIRASGAFNPDFKIAGDFDVIARLYLKYKIKTKYIPADFVTMTYGGASTKDEKAFSDGEKEIAMSCKSLGLMTNKVLLRLRGYYSLIARHIK